MDGENSLNMSLDEIIQSEKPIFSAPVAVGRGAKGRGAGYGGKIGGRGGGAFDRGSGGILMGTAPQVGMQFGNGFAAPPAMITPVGMQLPQNQMQLLPRLPNMNNTNVGMLSTPSATPDLLATSLLQQTAQVAATISKLGGNHAALATFNNSIPGLANAGSGEVLMSNAMDISRMVSQMADNTLSNMPVADSASPPSGLVSDQNFSGLGKANVADGSKPSFVKRGNYVEKLSLKRSKESANPLTFTFQSNKQRIDTASQLRKLQRQKVMDQSRGAERTILQPQNSFPLNPPTAPPQRLADPERVKNVRLGKVFSFFFFFFKNIFIMIYRNQTKTLKPDFDEIERSLRHDGWHREKTWLT